MGTDALREAETNLSEVKRLRDTLASLGATATEPEGGSIEPEKLPVIDAPPSAQNGKPQLTL